MKKPTILLLLFFALCLLTACQPREPLKIPALIPQPVSVVAGEGYYELHSNTKINIYKSIHLEILQTRDSQLFEEGYRLKVQKRGIQIFANTAAGLFYGFQTLTQLLPPEIESDHPAENITWRIPAVEIIDYPRFPWRGLLLDVSRHFFTKDEVLRYIDQMVKYKLNVLHLHLSDDQGWRVEIKSLPRLTEVGAWRVPRQGEWWSFNPPAEGEKATYGGFYTHEDIREIVQYAADRQVTILPEIDIPGHSLALIASYPRLSNTGLPYKVNPGSKFYTIEDNTLDPSNEEVYKVLDKIFTEIAALFPGEYIHIGGDECYKGFWAKNLGCRKLMQREGLNNLNELQSYFIKRVEKILQSKGKKMLGWDEILEGGLAPEATVMSWRGMQGGIKAARMGHKVVMTPTQHCYFDLYQGDPVIEPKTYSMLRLRDVYRFELLPEGIDSTLILGGQGNLWTESIATLRHAEYMTWPRAMALAEVLWSPASRRNWNSFTHRMEDHFSRFDAAGVKYARSAFDPIITIKKDEKKDHIEIETEIEGLDIYYSFDESYPDQYYPRYTGRLSIPKGAGSIRAVTYRNGHQIGRQIRKTISNPTLP